jgi:hypothetical protein
VLADANALDANDEELDAIANAFAAYAEEPDAVANAFLKISKVVLRF